MSGDLFAGIDLGGTKIVVLIGDADGRIVGTARVPTLATQGPESVLARIVEAVHEATKEAGVDTPALLAAGVSAPGPIDTAEGVITDPPNLPGWHNVPLASILRERLGVPAILENDANCGAVGEHNFGAGRGYKDMIFVTISTGIGGGIIIDNHLYAGASGAAGEVGHIGVSVDGPVCGAGHVGCLEAFASGTAIAARAREMIAAGGLPQTARLGRESPPLSAATVYQAGQQGEAEATAIVTNAGRYLGIGLAGILNAFNPQAIVLGGGLTNMGDTILGPAVETARTRSFPQSFMDARIVIGELEERAAALGALAVARNRQAKGEI
ncbi:MAG: ROK family protein [Chloroflexota bacterium]|nr:ROK family protein [Chloroflexota bacterium]